MLIGRVEGNAISTVKHASMTGWRMLVVQPIKAASNDPLLVIDSLGAGIGDLVVISNDGSGARELVGDRTSPVRWTTIGIVDDPGQVNL